MQLFFSSLSELDNFTHRLKALPEHNACQHCAKNDQWVSHGYVYKQSTMQRDIIGKRILCGRRFGRQGCGQTRQLYLDTTIPKRRYSLKVILAFISLLVNGRSVQHAYHRAIGHAYYEPRQAWRWLSTLERQLGSFRLTLNQRQTKRLKPHEDRSRRLNILLPTLVGVLKTGNFQRRQQQSFF